MDNFEISSLDLDRIGSEVLAKLASDSIPPIPSQYALCFEKIVKDKSTNVQKEIEKLSNSASSQKEKSRKNLEINSAELVANTKKLLDEAGKAYKALASTQKKVTERVLEIEHINNPSALKNLMMAVESDIKKLNSALHSYTDSMKEKYGTGVELLKSTKDDIIYDTTYELFNKKFFLEEIEKEIDSLNNFKHLSALLILRLNKNSSEEVRKSKQTAVINKSVSKMLSKVTRKSDILSHLGNGVFGILLRTVEEDETIVSAERLESILSNSHFFVGDRELALNLSIGIVYLNSDEDKTISLDKAKKAMDMADDNRVAYVVYRDEERDGEFNL